MFVTIKFVTIGFVANTFATVGRVTVVRSRRERPAKPALTQEGIVDAAMAVLRTDGIERLTMRRIAADLDTGPASLYVYVRSTTQVHALLIDRLLTDLDLAWDGSNEPSTRLHRLLVDYVELLASHPGLARSALVTWPQGEHYLDLVELVLRLLTASGVPDARSGWGVDVLLQQATAMAAEYGSRSEPDQAQTTDDLRAALSGADPVRYPTLARVGGDGMFAGRPADRRDWAIRALITGIVATEHPGE